MKVNKPDKNWVNKRCTLYTVSWCSKMLKSLAFEKTPNCVGFYLYNIEEPLFNVPKSGN